MTTTKELFAIASYDSKFVDYYLDVQGNLWSVKTGKPKMIKTHRFGLNGYTVHIENMIRDIRKTLLWQNYLDQISTKVQKGAPSVPVKRNCFVIAVIEDGVAKFSSSPKVHETDEAATEEVQRLVNANPGKSFAYFKCMGVAVANGVTWS
jgi:hypothetical protein